MGMDSRSKWLELAQVAQANVIEQDAADPGPPITEHEVMRATLHTRQDMVMVVTLLAGLIHQTEALHKRARTTNLLLAVIVLLLVIGIVRA